MATQVQLRGGTTTEHDSFTGASREVTVDTTKKTIVVHDGSTAGGIPLAKESGSTFTNVDINSGTIDGTVIGGASAGAGTFTTVTASGEIVANGGIALGDNDKATFGASDDLEIYHDASQSYVSHVGTGKLSIQRESTSGSISSGAELLNVLTKTGPSLHTAAVMGIHQPGSTEGIGDFRFSIGDGSGNLTETLRVNSTGIDVTGTVTADGLTVDGTAGFGSTLTVGQVGTGNYVLRKANTLYSYNSVDSNNDVYVQIYSNADYRLITNATERMRIEGTTGDISFYEDTGTTPKLFWDASAERLGIGTANPTSLLMIRGGAATATISSSTNSSNIDIINTTQTTRLGAINTDFAITHNGSERMRIDSTGALMVGTTSSRPAEFSHPDGFAVRGDVKGQIQNTVTNSSCAFFNRDGTDGAILSLRKEGVDVGSIGSQAGANLNLGNANVGLLFSAGGSEILPWNVSTNTASNGLISLGDASRRFQDLYLSGGVYVGGTTSANLLDDYEEGTWTPVTKGSTTAGTSSGGTVHGTYTKKGNEVTAWCYIAGISLTGAAGNLVVAGLPFAARSGTPAVAMSSSVRIENVDLPAGGINVGAVLLNNQQEVTFRATTDDSTAVYVTDIALSGSGIVFSITYQV